MGVEELLAALDLYGEDDGKEIDPNDSKEVFKALDRIKLNWILLEKTKRGENAHEQ